MLCFIKDVNFTIFMALNENEKYHLKKFIKELEEKQARHTEFVTVYVFYLCFWIPYETTG